MSNITFTKNDGIFEMLKWKNDAKISNDADLIYKQGGTMAYIKKKSERKFKITVCNGYKVNGQKRMKAQTITVPSSVPKRGIQQYVMAEAERIEKKFKYGVEESDQTHFEQYAENWLKRQQPFFKATTYAWHALTSIVHEDGKVGYVQPIGADPKKVDINDTEVYGTGAFLMAATEYIKYLKH